MRKDCVSFPMSEFGLRICVALLLALPCSFVSRDAAAQVGIRPGDERPSMSAFREPGALGSVLPALELPDSDAPGISRPATSPSLRVEGIRVVGNTLLPAELLKATVEPYTRGDVGLEQLLRLQDEITMLYVQRGYVTSGAMLAP